MLRVAIIGSGPAGVYSAAALVQHGDVSVDIFERLPCPFGLVRYGVAPDHPKIKSIASALRKTFEEPGVRFLGNVEVGRDLTLQDLHRHYDAVIYTSGAAVDRRLGIPGEDLLGSFSATQFVAWYCGHPDAPLDRFALATRQVAVIGVGNVALDVTRILAKTTQELRSTDLPDHVLEVLGRSQVHDIHLIGRRGPAQAKFSTKELRELGELTAADILVDPADLVLDEASAELAAAEPTVRRNLEVLAEWAQRTPAGRPRRVHLRFRLRPVEVLGTGSVSGLRLESTGSGPALTLDVGMVLRAVGYRGVPSPGLPFDGDRGVIPSAAGRVLREGAVVSGEYTAGWIKRGPTGVIGTNKSDAAETVASLLQDAGSLPPAPERDPDAVAALLAERGVDVVTWDGWRAIEAAEAELGRAQGRAAVKIADRAALLRAALHP
jgi:ferredoxin/flavodoxin---NADP+ reductase